MAEEASFFTGANLVPWWFKGEAVFVIIMRHDVNTCGRL